MTACRRQRDFEQVSEVARPEATRRLRPWLADAGNRHTDNKLRSQA